MKIRRDKRGFTLLEILIVLVIVATLAGLAIPVYTAQVEKSRGQEALEALSSTRQAMIRYYANNGTYATADISQAGCNIDYCPNPSGAAATGGQTLLFSYTLSNTGVTTFTITANRVNPPPGVSGIISVDQAGTVLRTGSYA